MDFGPLCLSSFGHQVTCFFGPFSVFCTPHFPSCSVPLFVLLLDISFFLDIFFWPIFFFFLLGLHLWHTVPQARGQISHSNARSEPLSVTYAAACDSARSLIHWGRPGIEPRPHRHYVAFLTQWTTRGAPLLTEFWFTRSLLLWVYCAINSIYCVLNFSYCSFNL